MRLHTTHRLLIRLAVHNPGTLRTDFGAGLAAAEASGNGLVMICTRRAGLALFLAAVSLPGLTAGSAVGAIRAAGGSSVAWAGGVPAEAWDWPVDGVPVVLRDFAPPPRPWLAGHRGVDLAGQPGQPVRAAGAGMVTYAGLVAGRGVVSVAHAGGLRTTYEPVTAVVRRGEPVALGQVLGVLDAGHAGCLDRGCLHWGLRRGEAYLDPLALVQPRPVRLKPWSGSAQGRPTGRRRGHRSPASRSIAVHTALRSPPSYPGARRVHSTPRRWRAVAPA